MLLFVFFKLSANFFKSCLHWTCLAVTMFGWTQLSVQFSSFLKTEGKYFFTQDQVGLANFFPSINKIIILKLFGIYLAYLCLILKSVCWHETFSSYFYFFHFIQDKSCIVTFLKCVIKTRHLASNVYVLYANKWAHMVVTCVNILVKEYIWADIENLLNRRVKIQ